ncbi:MAG TPA: histidinol-phosphate transaminase [Verrucomicrobiae bacterium]|nr:histidinol-phosphate transaminase [Verrucomicrobiae bacterium]
MSRNTEKLIRPLVRQLHPYIPGEQPAIRNLIKLNTNENPYPPSPRVLRAVQQAVDSRLRLYPNPAADPLRQRLAKMHGCAPENILVGNGSDEVLALAVRAFVEPVPKTSRTRQTVAAPRSTVQYFHPSYSLYSVLADTHGGFRNPVPLATDFSLPSLHELRRNAVWQFNAALTLITTPHAPSGRGYSTSELERLCRAQKGVTLLDEAYVDFANEHAMDLALSLPHVLVARTFSKAYSLCFQRVGYVVGNPVLISALHKIRDSYNVNGLGQVAAVATLDDLAYYQSNFKRIRGTREQLGAELTKLGFEVLPSQTNFILARPPRFPAEQWLSSLRERKVLVRWFRQPEVSSFLRITIGTPAEAEALIKAARRILKTQ